MKKILCMLVLGVVTATAAVYGEDVAVATKGALLYAADGRSLGAIQSVSSDGSAKVILEGKVLVVPASTISTKDGKLVTSLRKWDIVNRK